VVEAAARPWAVIQEEKGGETKRGASNNNIGRGTYKREKYWRWVFGNLGRG